MKTHRINQKTLPNAQIQELIDSVKQRLSTRQVNPQCLKGMSETEYFGIQSKLHYAGALYPTNLLGEYIRMLDSPTEPEITAGLKLLRQNGKIWTNVNAKLSTQIYEYIKKTGFDPFQCCFPTCQAMLSDLNYFYAEGIARLSFGGWQEHAWLMNRRGQIIDPTAPGRYNKYFGILVDPQYLDQAIEEYGVVFGSLFFYGYEFYPGSKLKKVRCVYENADAGLLPQSSCTDLMPALVGL